MVICVNLSLNLRPCCRVKESDRFSQHLEPIRDFTPFLKKKKKKTFKFKFD